MAAEDGRTSWLATLGWACYLACSWTWCIGMFLPVLLIRDYGVWGFVVFAVPNVLGAAGMGWVLRNSAGARRIWAAHRSAVLAFTGVTVLFHLYWLSWVRATAVGGVLFPAELVLVVLMVAIAVRPWGVSLPRWGGWRSPFLWACVALAASGIAAAVMGAQGVLRAPAWTVPGQAPTGVLWLAPVCAFGFALCPYLDATFLRCRAVMGESAARWAFFVGFGVVFAGMIVLTAFYAAAFPRAKGGAGDVADAFSLHLGAQTVFTVAAHLAAVVGLSRLVPGLQGVRVRPPWGLLVMVLAPLALGYGVPHVPGHAGLSAGEIIYRLFMAFYGLVFPAYVWLCMIPTRDGHAGLRGARGRVKRNIWLGSAGLAAPMFWMGFIERQEAWLAPGLGVVLAARLLLPRGREPAGPAASRSPG